MERFVKAEYKSIHCRMDDLIPFCDFLVVFNILWCVFRIGLMAYCLFFEVSTFRKMMWYFILTFTCSIAIYAVLSSCLELRPTSFPRTNAFTNIAQAIYQIDTNANVCPAMHVIGSVGADFAAYHAKRFSTIG